MAHIVNLRWTMIQRKFPLSARGLVLLLAIVFSAGTLFAADVPRMSKEELKAALGKPDVLVIDVRTEKDWKDSAVKIKGALRQDPAKSTTWLESLPKDKTLVLYCA